jgi:hypothetical protein
VIAIAAQKPISNLRAGDLATNASHSSLEIGHSASCPCDGALAWTEDGSMGSRIGLRCAI